MQLIQSQLVTVVSPFGHGQARHVPHDMHVVAVMAGLRRPTAGLAFRGLPLLAFVGPARSNRFAGQIPSRPLKRVRGMPGLLDRDAHGRLRHRPLNVVQPLGVP